MSRSLVSSPYFKKTWDSVRRATKNSDLALDHFDGLYAKVYGRAWPSMRLGLLSPKKQCLILNSFVDAADQVLAQVPEAVDIQRYYKKHLLAYTRWQLREQLLENKRVRKRELLGCSDASLDTIEVSDISDSELKTAQTSDSEGISPAEDLFEMFSDRRMDEDEKYFINQASTQLSLNDYVPVTEMIHREEMTNELSYYEGFDEDVKLDVEFKQEPSFEVDNQLKIHTIPRGIWSQLPTPYVVPTAKLYSHYLLDGASILPVLALDLRFDDECADYCAAPGGKSLAMLMTFKPKSLLCNDISVSRLAKLSKVFRQYAPAINYVNSTVKITNKDARSMVHPDSFDKILVDVPCSNDRTSVEFLDNNIFKRARTEERLQLPSTQCDILTSALKSLKPKGSLVYSTCTMSPVENDGVVQRALIRLQEADYPSKFAVVNLKEAFRPFRGLIKFNTKFKFGQQVVPSICSNFGPMYISKIKRLS